MESRRQHKVSKLIQKELSIIFQQDTKHLFGSLFISVTGTSVSPDLSIAKIYISLMQAEGRQAAFEKIQQKKPEIRKILGNKIGRQVRKIPDLVFYLDEGQEHASKIEEILDKLNIPDKTDDSEI